MFPGAHHGNPDAFPDLGDGPGSHGEVEGFEGFTGVRFWDRMEHTGYVVSGNYDRMASGEVITYVADPALAVDRWMKTVYHRFPFVDVHNDEMGYGIAEDAQNKADVMNFGRTKWAPQVDTGLVIVYPADGQTGLNPEWNSDTERPDPYLSDDWVGTVITLSPVGNQTFDRLELRPEGGDLVDVYDLESKYGHYYTAAKDPLEPNTRYLVTAYGTDNADRPMTMEWSFTTGESTMMLQGMPAENRRVE